MSIEQAVRANAGLIAEVITDPGGKDSEDAPVAEAAAGGE